MIKKIRKYLKNHQLNAVIIPRNDSFLGAFLPQALQVFKAASGGFDASYGAVLVGLDKVVVFVSARDEVQSKMQTNYEVVVINSATSITDYIKSQYKKARIAYNPTTHSYAWRQFMAQELAASDIDLYPMKNDSIIDIFGELAVENVDIFALDSQFCGQKSEEKLQKVADFVQKNELDAYFIASAENVSWLLNIRSLTVLEYPVVFQRGFVDKNGVYTPFLPNMDMATYKNWRIGLDFAKTPVFIVDLLQKCANIVDMPDCIDGLKSVKNAVEIENIKKACISESKAICQFLAWVEREKSTLFELDCIAKLPQLRAQDDFYIADSFPTICASGKNAASIHYEPTSLTNRPLADDILLMLDTGGHYLTGSTDMTRTICLNTPTDIIKKRYTQVLKGHIALSMAVIDKNESVSALDSLARQYLKADEVDYPHATGHGIGYLLGVHEMPLIIAPKSTDLAQSGMIFSNEPGFYDEKLGFGLRLENMLLAQDKNESYVHFQDLLFTPFDYRLIDTDLLTTDEKKWLKSYHQHIKVHIFPLLSDEDVAILEPFIAFYKDFS